MRSAIARSAIAAGLALAVSACHDATTEPAAALRAARNTAGARWQASAPAAYTFVAERSCECLADARGPVRVTVNAGAIVRVVRVDSGAPVDATLWFDINALFALIDRELEDMPERLIVEYHPTMGYPVHVTWGMIEVDGGAVITVSDLAATTAP